MAGSGAAGAPNAANAANAAIGVQAQRLFDSLPYAYRLTVTRQRFPHVLERIAAAWESPARMLALFDDLMLDQRGGRQGFPFETVIEITNLRDYYIHEVRPGLPATAPRPANHDRRR